MLEGSNLISKTRAVYAGLKHLGRSLDIPLKSKGCVDCAAVHSFLLYGLHVEYVHCLWGGVRLTMSTWYNLVWIECSREQFKVKNRAFYTS